MSSLARIPADIRNEFVVDSKGQVFAKSFVAIARLAGVSRQTLFTSRVTGDTGLLVKIRCSQNLPECLERFAGQDFTYAAKIPDIVVSAIIEYYAYVSEAANETARLNFRAMAAVGFRAWFQQELGWKPQETVMSKVEALRAYADMLEEKEKLETKHPGLRLLSGETVELEGLSPSFTIREWLDYKGYPATTQQCKNFGKLVANTKRTLMQVKYHPDVQHRQSNKEYCYDDLDMIAASWESFNEPDE
jgi:hypothetical protein